MQAFIVTNKETGSTARIATIDGVVGPLLQVLEGDFEPGPTMESQGARRSQTVEIVLKELISSGIGELGTGHLTGRFVDESNEEVIVSNPSEKQMDAMGRFIDGIMSRNEEKEKALLNSLRQYLMNYQTRHRRESKTELLTKPSPTKAPAKSTILRAPKPPKQPSSPAPLKPPSLKFKVAPKKK